MTLYKIEIVDERSEDLDTIKSITTHSKKELRKLLSTYINSSFYIDEIEYHQEFTTYMFIPKTKCYLVRDYDTEIYTIFANALIK